MSAGSLVFTVRTFVEVESDHPSSGSDALSLFPFRYTAKVLVGFGALGRV